MRNVSADLLRIICCMMIIGIHSTPDYSMLVKLKEPDAIVFQSLIIQSVVRIGLPVFFMMSGYFLLNRNSESLFLGYKKRFVSLLIPFFIYAFLNYYFQHEDIFEREGVSGFFRLLLESKTAISTHLWFVYVLTGIYIIIPAIKVVTDSIPNDKSIIAIVVIAIICSWFAYENQLAKIWPDYKIIVPIPRIDVWLGYFVIGGLLYRVDISKKSAFLLLVVSLPIQILFTWLSENSLGFDTKPYDFGLNMFLSASAMILFINKLSIQNHSFFSKVILFLAPYTYGIYLIHIVVIKWVSDYFSVPLVVNMVIVKTISYIFIVFILSLVIALLVDNLIVRRIISLVR
ncbi:acyltransferase family protein [Escherichia coli]|nr:acyltransferase family protein [Escherichia coli]